MRFRRLALTTVLLAPAFVALPVTAAPRPDPHPVEPQIHTRGLSGVEGTAVRALRDGKGPRGRRLAARDDLRVLTARTSTKPFELVGVTWTKGRTAADLDVRVRTRKESGGWTAWNRLPVAADESPDEQPGVRGATQPVWVGDADGVQVAVASPDAELPQGLRLELVDPGESKADRGVTAPDPAAAADAATPMPDYISRAEWGADESMRHDDPDYGDTIIAGFVHHTVTAVDYEPSDSPGIVRSIYAYHTSNGWDDIGYNFLVDQYGQVFEGRWGGVDKPVIGGHTRGMNTDTFGVAALGNFEKRRPTSSLLHAIEKVAAYKLDMYGRDARGTVVYHHSDGSSETIDVLSGHRDVGATLCPGEYLYAQLPGIRRRTARRMSSDRTPSVPAGGDFDGDGYRDVVLRAPGEAFGSRDAAGMLNVVPGSPGGPRTDRAVAWSQGSSGVRGVPEKGDRFGYATAVGDFDGDSYDDLAVGVPFEALGGAGDRHGMVHVLYGSANGLTARGAETLKIGQAGVAKDSGDAFGYALAAGDTDGDGFDELAVGAVRGGPTDDGAVVVYAGSGAGLATGSAVLYSGGHGLPPDPKVVGDHPDRVGAALVMGDTDGDGTEDLAIGAPNADVAGAPQSGAAYLLPGGGSGLEVAGATIFTQATPGVPGGPERGDHFGSSLTMGQLDGAFGLDLAVGSRGEGLGGRARVGMVHVLYSGQGGLSGADAEGWHQGSGGVPGVNERGDRFGDPMLAAGDFDGDTYDDLAVSVRAEDVGSSTDSGTTVVIPGSSTGLSSTGIRSWHQGTAGVPGAEERHDQLGSSVAVADVDADGRGDLVVGVRGENRREGRAVVLSGSRSGLTSSGATNLSQDTPGVPGVGEPGDALGS